MRNKNVLRRSVVYGKPSKEPSLRDVSLKDFGGDINAWCSWRACNDYGNAERLIARHGDDLVFVRGSGWHAWDGQRWNRIEGENCAQLWAQLTAVAICEEANDAGERATKLRTWARESGNQGRLTNMLKCAKPHLTREPDEMDAHPFLLAVSNGTIELGKRIKFREHLRNDLLTRQCPTVSDDASASVFNDFLAKIMPDEKRRAFLQRWFGYCLTGDVSEQVMALFLGTGSNGKSTLINAISHVVGDLHVPLPISSLLYSDRRSGGDATPDLARLPGARFVTASEPEVGARFSESAIKSMTGSEMMTARHLNRGFFDFTPQFKVTISANNKPSIRGNDDGIWRRILLVPFEVKVGPEDVGPVYEALEEEGPGILKWLLDGVEAWYREGLAVPDSVRTATHSYRSASDPIGEFLGQWTRKVEGETTPAARLYAAYQVWCKENEVGAASKTKFGLVLGDKGYRKEKISIIVYMGVKLTKEALDSLDSLESSEPDHGSHESPKRS